MTADTTTTISTFSEDEITEHSRELGMLLHDCVHAGACINFVLPYPLAEAEAFWLSKVHPAVRNGKLVMLVAWNGGRIAGSVQLDYDTPPNQPYRAEVRKLMVHPDFRRMGIAKLLMIELELLASRLGRTLLTLDTRTGDTAEPLYTSLGYITIGVIPDFCLNPAGDGMDAATFMYKKLESAK